MPSTDLRNTLLGLQQRDLSVREELAADGSLYEGYHPRMEEVHRDNARQLRELIQRFGWPNEQLASAVGVNSNVRPHDPMHVSTLTAQDAPRYRALMLHAYEAAADAFTSTAKSARSSLSLGGSSGSRIQPD